MPAYDLTITRILNIHHTSTATWAMPRPVFRQINGLVYFEEGSITYHFDQGDQTAHPGDALIFPKGMHYFGEKLTPMNRFIVIDFETPPEETLEMLHLPRVLKCGEEVGRLFRQCAEAWKRGGLQFPLQCRSDVYLILTRLSALHNWGSRRSAQMEEILSYIHAHYTDPGLEVEEISREFHISASQLRRTFRETLNISPLQYILKLRMELAQNLLLHECLPVSEVAGRSGFSSEFYFSRLFKQRTGVPPSAFKWGGQK